MTDFKFTEAEREDIRIYMNSQVLTDGEIIDRIESIIQERGDGWVRVEEKESCDNSKDVLSKLLELKPTPLPVSFLDWVSFYGYIRLSKSAGHKWFKLNDGGKLYTTDELYDLFVNEVNTEQQHEAETSSHLFHHQ